MVQIATTLGLLLASCAPATAQAPYKVTRYNNYTNVLLDKTDQNVLIFVPEFNTRKQEKDHKWPILVYAHGAAGGNYDINGYDLLFRQIAEKGYVVIAHKSCSAGCHETEPSVYTECAGIVPLPPTGGKMWGVYYGETLKMIDWAKTSADFDFHKVVNFNLGIAIAGHSMGGQSTAIASNINCTKQWDIRAAVMHHPESVSTNEAFCNAGNNIYIPTAIFPSSGDNVCPASDSKDIYESMHQARLFRNLEGDSHLEPVLLGTTDLARLTVAWLDIYMNGVHSPTYDVSHSTIYDEHDETGICNYADMVECMADNRSKAEI